MPLQRVPINNFRGGLNTRDGPFDLQPNESPDLHNVTISSLVGQLEVRQGKTRFDAGTALTNQTDFAKQIVLGTSYRFLMLSVNGAIVSCDTTGNLVTRHTGTAGTVWTFEQYADNAGVDWVWCMNGTDTPQKWDGHSATSVDWVSSCPALAPDGSAWPTGSVLTIPNGTILKVWQNRMMVSGDAAFPQRVFFSDFGDVEQIANPYGYIDLRGPEDELDAVTEMNVLADRLYVFRPRSVFAIFDPVKFNNRRIGQPGCASRFQSAESEGKLYYFNGQGLWSTEGVAIAMESGSINNYFPANLNYPYLNKARLISTNDTYPRLLLALPIGTSTFNNSLIEMVPHINFRRIGGRRYLLLPAFMIHDLQCTALATYKPLSEEVLIGTDPINFKVYEIFNGANDDGTNIDAWWQSAWMAIQGEEPKERVRRLNVELSGRCHVDVYTDFNTTSRFSVDLPYDDGTWDSGLWESGDEIWDAALKAYDFVRVRPETHGRFHAVRFTNVNGSQFLINVAELVIRGGKEH